MSIVGSLLPYPSVVSSLPLLMPAAEQLSLVSSQDLQDQVSRCLLAIYTSYYLSRYISSYLLIYLSSYPNNLSYYCSYFHSVLILIYTKYLISYSYYILSSGESLSSIPHVATRLEILSRTFMQLSIVV